MKKMLPLLVVVAVAALAYFLWQSSAPIDEPGHATPSGVGSSDPASSAKLVRLDVGLSAEEEKLWHHHDEGSGFIPLSFFHALIDSETGKPFIEALPRFGLVADPSNAYGLPIGMTAGGLSTAPNDSLFVGVNCAACHSGQYTYQGTAMTIDGSPNMLDFEALLAGLTSSLKATLKSPTELLRMVRTMMEWEKRLAAESRVFGADPEAIALLAEAAKADPNDDQAHALDALHEHLAQGLHDALHAGDAAARSDHLEQTAAALPSVDHQAHGLAEEASEKLKSSLGSFEEGLAFLRRHADRLVVLAEAFEGETVGGPGRADSFGAIWDLLVQKGNMTALDAPVSIPELFEYATFEWIHWDGNSNSVMGRDYAQAIALGADMIEETHESTVLPRGLIALEETARKLKSPAWPEEILGAIDREKASRGEALYAEHCSECHSGYSLTPVEEIGTDPLRAMNFAELGQDGKTYAELLIELGNVLTETSYAAHGVTPEEIAPIERSADPTWRITKSYHSRTLAGIWASPPYLHNGSVPTLWDLLQSAADRPSEFQVGRELDATKVGTNATGQPGGGFTFRAAETGNGNGGHEYGVELSDEEKWALVEYMKTL